MPKATPSTPQSTILAQSRAYSPPSVFSRRVIDPAISRLGLAPTLLVRGRRSGRVFRVPLAPIEHDGALYLVAQRGETNWVRNLRAAGVADLRRRWRTRSVRAVEVVGDERDRAVAAYRAKQGIFVRGSFARLPDPSDHPTFRLEPVRDVTR